MKAVQPGWAAHAGLTAAALARAGVTGPSSVFEGPSGFFELYGRDAAAADRLREEVATFGERWLLPEAAFKAHPCCHFIHPFLECLDQLGPALTADRVRTVQCVVPTEQIPVIADPWPSRQHPRSGHDARWSLPYVLAARLHDGSVGLDLFDGDVRPELCALAERFSVQPWPGSGHPDRFPARLSVTLTTGETMEAHVDDVRGSPARPFAAAQVREKFLTNARAGGLPDAVAGGLADELLCASTPDVATVGRILRGPTEGER